MTPLTAIDAAVALAECLDCLHNWTETLDALEPAGLVDLDPIARAVCILNHVTRNALGQLEDLAVGS